MRIALVLVVLLACDEKRATVEVAPPGDPVRAAASAEPDAAVARPLSDAEIEALTAEMSAAAEESDHARAAALGAKLVAALRVTKPNDRALAEALLEYGTQLERAGAWPEAQATVEEALAHAAVAADAKLRMDVQYRLGSIYSEIHEIEKATKLLRAALDTAKSTLDPDSLDTHLIKEQLASALDYGGHYAEAEPLFRELVAYHEANEDSLRTGISYVNLAVNLEFQERDAEALKLYLRAVKLLTGKDSYSTDAAAEGHAGMGRIHRRAGKAAQAIAAFRRALAIRRKTYGDDHPIVARDMHNLALQLDDAKQKKEAASLCAKALAIREAKLPEGHPDRDGTATLCAQIRGE